MHVSHSVDYPIAPDVRVTPAEIDEEEPTFAHPARITLWPFGLQTIHGAGVSWSFTLDEARRVAQALLGGVAEAEDLLGPA